MMGPPLTMRPIPQKMSQQDATSDSITTANTAIRKALDRARRHYNIKLPEASVDYSLRGRCAGQAHLDRNGQLTLRINRQLLEENLEDFLKQTIPHEVAHLVVQWQARKARSRPKPHGQEWQKVMQACFGLEPKRCHSYRTTPARVVTRPFLYRCECRKHQLTSIMHKRVSRSLQALCKSCRSPLQFVNKQGA